MDQGTEYENFAVAACPGAEFIVEEFIASAMLCTDGDPVGKCVVDTPWLRIFGVVRCVRDSDRSLKQESQSEEGAGDGVKTRLKQRGALGTDGRDEFCGMGAQWV